jgi:hypothetical protein
MRVATSPLPTFLTKRPGETFAPLWTVDVAIMLRDCVAAMSRMLRRSNVRNGVQPRPMNGIWVAITVMNWTLAESGRPAM